MTLREKKLLSKNLLTGFQSHCQDMHNPVSADKTVTFEITQILHSLKPDLRKKFPYILTLICL